MNELTVKRIGQKTALILMLAWTIDYMDRFVVSLALPSIGAEFHLSKAEQGLIVTTFAVVYMCMQVPAGLIADRVPSKPLLLTTLVFWSVFTALTGLATGFIMLLVFRGLFGVCQGLYPPTSFKALSERSMPEQRGGLTGFMMSAQGLGPGIAPLVAAPLMAMVGWRHTFTYFALAGLVIGVILFALIPKPLPRHLTDEHAEQVDEQALDASLPAVSQAEVLRSPNMWKLAGLWCVLNIVNYGLITWVPSYLMEVRKVALADTGILASIPMLITILTTWLGGWLFDRYFHNRTRWFIIPIWATTGILLVLMIMAKSTLTFTLFVTLANGVSCLATMAIFGIPLRVLPRDRTGTATGLINVGGQIAGAASPLIMGLLADAYSFTAAFGFLVVGTIVGVIIGFRVPNRTEDFTIKKAKATVTT